MFRVTAVAFAAVLAALVPTVSASAGDARTTRIEPRPFYGATITLEAGVRVFRPLPPHKNIIINPGHRTPLNLTVKDVTERRYIQSHNTHYYRPAYPAQSGGTVAGGYIGGPVHHGRGFKRRRHSGGDGAYYRRGGGKGHYRGGRGHR